MSELTKADLVEQALRGHEKLCIERHKNIRDDITEVKRDIETLTEAVAKNTLQTKWAMGVGVTIMVILGLALEAWRTFS